MYRCNEITQFFFIKLSQINIIYQYYSNKEGEKTMKRIVSILLCLVCIFALTACSQFPDVDGDYIVLELQKKNNIEASPFENTLISSTYSLNANGELTCVDFYTITGNEIKQTSISKDTVLKLVGLIEEAKRIRDTEVEGTVSYEVNYFDKEKNVLVDYKGEIVPEYEDFVNTIVKAINKVEDKSFNKKGIFMEFKSLNPSNLESWTLSQNNILTYEKENERKEIKLKNEQIDKIQRMLNIQNVTANPWEDDINTSWQVCCYDTNGQCLKYFSGSIELQPNLLEIYDLLVSLV